MPKSKEPSEARPPTVPDELGAWLAEHGAKTWIVDTAWSPGSEVGRKFVLATVDLGGLEFAENDYNPREANEGKVHELMASVIQLSLLNPLTCAYLDPADRAGEDDGAEPVVLIDGRHRFNALKELREDRAWTSWAETARVDLKIFFGLLKSDLYLLATYLNRTRKALKKGEYYLVIYQIFQAKEIELESASGRPVTEVDVFRSISSKAVPNKAVDLSVGRIIAITAFDDEEKGGWYPMVGLAQKSRLPRPLEGYSPLTAGNLAVFLAWLCKTGPYDDRGKARATEITNVIRLGRLFREIVLTAPVLSYEEASGVSVGSKHWVLDAFGKILARANLFGKPDMEGQAPLARTTVDWKALGRILKAYREIMDKQADVVNEYRAMAQPPPDFLSRAWSYQTQTKQIEGPLARELDRRIPKIGLLP